MTKYALESAGVSVSKRNVDALSAKKKVATEAAKKRHIADLEKTRVVLENKVPFPCCCCTFSNVSQEKEERTSLTNLKKKKQKLEKQMENVRKNAFPLADELIPQVDEQGDYSAPLPSPVVKLDVPDFLALDVLFVWDFLFSFK